ncbi:hypothetical protein LENED_012608 [Lentinula edodes]|uniref:Uncharacterized protein n=1 Tax=Lentinula edodes TaxID=5353 RepID=A0A1Q3ESZ1_LENED|nr:hypothetical protein LENED_012608 [Lentinula edodes]
MSSSRTTTIGSIPVTGRQPTPPVAPTRPSTLDPSDEERELELQLERTRERSRRRKEEKKKAEEEAKRKAEEERERQEGRQCEENGGGGGGEEEENSGSGSGAESVKVEIPRVAKKGKAPQRNEASGGDPDDGDDGENDDEEDEERAPCERCYSKKIPCLEQVGNVMPSDQPQHQPTHSHIPDSPCTSPGHP